MLHERYNQVLPLKGDRITVTSDNFADLAMRTTPGDLVPIIARLKDPRTVRLLHAQMGLTSEVGEFADQLKRHIFYGNPIDLVNLVEEMGDLLWYLAEGSDAINVHLETVMAKVITKLARRYPEKFTEKAATDRNLGDERKSLEADIA